VKSKTPATVAKSPKPGKAKRPVGRPTDYSPDLAASMCADIAFCQELGRPLKVHEVCIRYKISVASFFLWLTKYKEFSEAYAHARDARAEQYFEETVEIADSLPTGIRWKLTDGSIVESIEGLDPDLAEGAKQLVLSKEEVMRADLQVRSRQWYLMKLMPHRFGNKIQTEHTGPGGGAVIVRRIIDDIPE
jgi:hypothetical protein